MCQLVFFPLYSWNSSRFVRLTSLTTRCIMGQHFPIKLGQRRSVVIVLFSVLFIQPNPYQAATLREMESGRLIEVRQN